MSRSATREDHEVKFRRNKNDKDLPPVIMQGKDLVIEGIHGDPPTRLSKAAQLRMALDFIRDADPHEVAERNPDMIPDTIRKLCEVLEIMYAWDEARRERPS